MIIILQHRFKFVLTDLLAPVIVVLSELLHGNLWLIFIFDFIQESQVSEDSPEKHFKATFVQFLAIAEQIIKEFQSIVIILMQSGSRTGELIEIDFPLVLEIDVIEDLGSLFSAAFESLGYLDDIEQF